MDAPPLSYRAQWLRGIRLTGALLIAYLLCGAAFFLLTAIVTGLVSGAVGALGFDAAAQDVASQFAVGALLFAFGPVVLYRLLSTTGDRFAAILHGE